MCRNKFSVLKKKKKNLKVWRSAPVSLKAPSGPQKVNSVMNFVLPLSPVI